MEKLKSLLLPLAMVFGAIAVFEFGARYGATNMRAYGIAGELKFPLGLYAQAQGNMDQQSKENFALFIDNGIAAGALHREVWYLQKDAKAALDNVLTYALSVRGEGVLERFSSDEIKGLNPQRLAEIKAAVAEAKEDLITNTPSVAEKEAEEAAAAE